MIFGGGRRADNDFGFEHVKFFVPEDIQREMSRRYR